MKWTSQILKYSLVCGCACRGSCPLVAVKRNLNVTACNEILHNIVLSNFNSLCLSFFLFQRDSAKDFPTSVWTNLTGLHRTGGIVCNKKWNNLLNFGVVLMTILHIWGECQVVPLTVLKYVNYCPTICQPRTTTVM